MNSVASYSFTLLCILIWLSGSEAFSTGSFNNQADACLRLHPTGHGVPGQTADPEYVIEVSQDYYEPGIPLQGTCRRIVFFVPSLSHSFQLSWLTLSISFLLSSLSPFWLHLFVPFLSLFLFILFVVVVLLFLFVIHMQVKRISVSPCHIPRNSPTW